MIISIDDEILTFPLSVYPLQVGGEWLVRLTLRHCGSGGEKVKTLLNEQKVQAGPFSIT